MDLSSIMALIKAGSDSNFLQDMGKSMKAAMEEQQYSTLLDPAFYGQKNASSSNAPLDNSLGEEARKTAGVAEGGATPQLDNTVSSDLVGVKRTPTAAQAVAPKEGLFSGKGFVNKIASGIMSYLNR